MNHHTSPSLRAWLTILIAGSAAAGRAALIVNQDLGTLGFGTTPLSGTTVGGANNANQYNGQSTAAFWGSEYVYQFTLAAAASLTLNTSDTDSGTLDNDFFLLNSLATTSTGGFAVATPAGFTYTSGLLGNFPAGTYYLSVDAFAGADSAGTGLAGAFSASLIISAANTAPASTPAIPGGAISTSLAAAQVLWYSFSHAGGAFLVDTVGSALGPDNDTELFLYASSGVLIAANDDTTGLNLLSRISIADLAAGDYFLAAGGWNMVGSGGWTVSSTSGESGTIVINGLTAVPEPGAAALVLAAAAAGLRRRRSVR